MPRLQICGLRTHKMGKLKRNPFQQTISTEKR